MRLTADSCWGSRRLGAFEQPRTAFPFAPARAGPTLHKHILMKDRPQGASVCRALTSQRLTPRSRPTYQEIPPLVTRPTTSRPWLHLITGRQGGQCEFLRVLDRRVAAGGEPDRLAVSAAIRKATPHAAAIADPGGGARARPHRRAHRCGVNGGENPRVNGGGRRSAVRPGRGRRPTGGESRVETMCRPAV